MSAEFALRNAYRQVEMQARVRMPGSAKRAFAVGLALSFCLEGGERVDLGVCAKPHRKRGGSASGALCVARRG